MSANKSGAVTTSNGDGGLRRQTSSSSASPSPRKSSSGLPSRTFSSSSTTTASPSQQAQAQATPMSTSALEAKLRALREESASTSHILTQKLASSQSGQNLLHMGSALSTLPPDLHALLQQLHPVLSQSEAAEKALWQSLQETYQSAQALRLEQRRVHHAKECATLYTDLVAAERCLSALTATAADKRQQQLEEEDATELQSEGDDDCDILDLPGDDDNDNHANDGVIEEAMDRASSLERAAHITLCLVEELHSANQALEANTHQHHHHHSSNTVSTSSNSKSSSHTAQNAETANANNGASSSSPAAATTTTTTSWPSLRARLEPDTERAQCLVQMAPRIRRLEFNVATALVKQLEKLLQDLQQLGDETPAEEAQNQPNDDPSSSGEKQDPSLSSATATATTKEQQPENGNSTHSQARNNKNDENTRKKYEDALLLMLGHCVRGLAMLGRGKEVEAIFARVAIMPLVRTRVSMGRLDQGGSRGECAGLPLLLDDMAKAIADTYGPVLAATESMFHSRQAQNSTTSSSSLQRDVDLLTGGVWVPIATALMSDTGIRMAIFAPGIAKILQANYTALDLFLSQLAQRMLQPASAASGTTTSTTTRTTTANESGQTGGGGSSSLSDLYYRPQLTDDRIREAQARIYAHPKTAEFSKKWNLPIYYQLRFGECCSRLNKAIELTQHEGWISQAFSGSDAQSHDLRQRYGFELALFMELFDILLGLWRPDVIIRPLSNRFIRGAVQLLGRTISFISDGMEGKIKFGDEPRQTENGVDNGANSTAPTSRRLYCWGDSEHDVAAVAWELTILDSTVRHDYVDTICDALTTTPSGNSNNSTTSANELRPLVLEVLQDAADQIHPLIDKAWNEKVVNILTSKCTAPLAAVKGVAATYRMTNRPPPTQASPFVATILRPLKEFEAEFRNRTPDRVGSKWKHEIVVTSSSRYAAAVQELLATVQRTEVALKNRKARRAAAGGMSDGEKVKLQLYLDYLAFANSVKEVGVDGSAVIGLSTLRDLTSEGESLRKQNS